jgi:hypothetical protein
VMFISALLTLMPDRFPSRSNRVLVDHTTDLRLFTPHRNPRHPSHSDARQIAIQLLFGLSLVGGSSLCWRSQTIPSSDLILREQGRGC